MSVDTMVTFPCPEPGCLIFPFTDEIDLALHIGQAEHVYDGQWNRLGINAELEAKLADRGEGGGGRGTPIEGPTHGRWKKVGGEFVVYYVGGEPGQKVTVEKASGDVSEVTLGEKVKASHFRPQRAAVDPDVYRWAKVDGDWLVAGPPAETGSVITITKADGATVEAKIVGTVGDKFRVEKVVAAVAPELPAGVELEDGRVYATADGTMVKATQAKAGHFYGKTWSGSGWEFAPGVIKRVTRQVSAEEAAAFGHQYERCVFCSRKLSDDGEGRSVEVGYGPVCAENYGLPWG